MNKNTDTTPTRMNSWNCPTCQNLNAYGSSTCARCGIDSHDTIAARQGISRAEYNARMEAGRRELVEMGLL